MDRRDILAGCAGLALAARAGDALGQSGPLTRIIYPFAAGGSGDALCRVVAQHLGPSLDPPGTLLIAGGETLKALSVAVGANALQVSGRLEPGVPRSVIKGGPWAGIDVISKSGAFGPPDLWWKLLSRNGFEF